MYDSEHIILIDDDDNDRELHQSLLRRAGFTGQLTLFDSATDALAAITGKMLTGRKTLLLVDVNMPTLDGFELISAMVGELDAHSEVSIVMLSGSHDHHDRSRAGNLPIVSDYLTKPLTMEGSVSLMSRFLT